jgi:murein DD-endopeptidase MepM/ murein hydrolase activator NlpD
VAWAPTAVTPAGARAAGPGVPVPDPVADARQKVLDARNEANAAAARFTEAQSRYERTGDQIAEIEAKISKGEERAAHLREIAQHRALVAYKTQGADLSALVDADSPRQGLRGAVFLDAANAADNQAVTEYVQLADELAALRERLAGEREVHQQALNQLAQERKLLDTKLGDAMEAQQNLQAKLWAALAASPGSSPAGLVNAPVIDGLVCPVPGAAFTNDWGQPRSGGRSHQGNDLFAPMGTSNLAVVAGDVTFGEGGLGGMGATLNGDNGVKYIYYHLSEYVGGPRRVAQGEVIGKLGETGNATTPHTHFEVHPGGGAAVNPYPTVAKIC